MSSNPLIGIKNRVLQEIARICPGARSLRPTLHRWRGVKLGSRVWVGYDCVLETSRPHLISIGNDSILSVRVLLIAHFRGTVGIQIEEDVFVGPGAIILPGVTLGRGCVITAGSVVSASIPPMMLAQGNPARPIARCGASLVTDEPLEKFQRSLRPLKPHSRSTLAQ